MNSDFKRNLCFTTAILIFIAGIIGGCYVGIWLMFIKPLIEIGRMYDEGSLTGSIIISVILKFIFSSFVGSVIFYACTYIAREIIGIGENIEN